MKPQVSVVLITLNPVPAILEWAIDALENQTLPPDRFELVIVDNGSNPAVASLAAVCNRPFEIRLTTEPRPGQIHARCRGIAEAEGDLIVFVDDDNYLDPAYLATAIEIANREPSIGAFGGVSQLLTNARQPAWKEPLYPFMAVRNYGSDPITSNQTTWGRWEPIGAGMVFRRDVGAAYLDVVRTKPVAQRLGRSKTSNVGGEDVLVARCAYSLGYSCSYQPALKLTHFIPSSRFKAMNLFRTIEGIGRAYVLYEIVMGTQHLRAAPLRVMLQGMILNARQRIRRLGWKAGLIESGWDVGYLREIRRCAREGILAH